MAFRNLLSNLGHREKSFCTLLDLLCRRLETVISVCKNIPGFQCGSEKGSFKGWLMKLTGWRISDQLRKRQITCRIAAGVDADYGSVTDLIADPGAFDPSSYWEEEWNNNLLAVALERVKARVDPKTFQTFELCVLQQASVKRVRRLMRVSTATVYLRKHRVSVYLRLELARLKRETEEPPRSVSRQGRRQ